MKFVNKLTLVLSKIFEVIHWIGVGGVTVLLIASIFDFKTLSDILLESVIDDGRTLTGYGFDVTAISTTGEVNKYAVIIFFIGAIIAFTLTAMVFRNVHLIMKTLMGKNKNIESVSPFQKDIIRMIKEIGLFTMTIPVVSIFLSIVVTAVSIISGIPEIEISVGIDGFMVGLISLCLTNVFTYGASLEKDVDGLL